MTNPRLLLPDSYRRNSWKNGQGISFDIAGQPLDLDWATLAWRLSIAEIGADCAFSEFPGIDRTFMAIAGRGLTLMPENRKPIPVGALFHPISFPGEWRIHCRLHDGPARALNVFTARNKARHRLRILRKSEGMAFSGTALFHALDGRARCDDTEIPVGATLLFDAAGAVEVDCPHGSTVAYIQIELEKPA